MERVERSKFLGVQITNELSWSTHNKSVMKRARPNLFPLRRLKRFVMGPQTLKRFYSCTTESILTGCIAAWYGNCSAFGGTEGGANGPIEHWGQASYHPGPI